MNNKKKDTNPKFQDVIPDFPVYLEYTDDKLLERLHTQLTTFNLAMERVGAGKGYDPLPIQEAQELATFWHDIKSNIRVLMEMHDFAESELSGREYDPSKPGRYLWYKSLVSVAEEMKRAN